MELVAWSRERLARHKYPRQVRFVDELPLGPSHKVLKRELRHRLAAGRSDGDLASRPSGRGGATPVATPPDRFRTMAQLTAFSDPTKGAEPCSSRCGSFALRRAGLPS